MYWCGFFLFFFLFYSFIGTSSASGACGGLFMFSGYSSVEFRVHCTLHWHLECLGGLRGRETWDVWLENASLCLV